MLCCGTLFLSFPDMQDNRQEAGSNILIFNLHQHSINPRLTPPDGRDSWFCNPRAGWRSAISHTFFSYGIFLPFWSVWLKGIGLTPETIGLLLGRVWLPVSSGVCSSRPRQRSFPPDFRLARAGTADTSLCCRLLGGAHVAWLMLVMIGFNLFSHRWYR